MEGKGKVEEGKRRGTSVLQSSASPETGRNKGEQGRDKTERRGDVCRRLAQRVQLLFLILFLLLIWTPVKAVGSRFKGIEKCCSGWILSWYSHLSELQAWVLGAVCLVVMSRARWLDVKLHSIILTWNIKPLPCSVLTLHMFLGRSCCRHQLSILSN